MTDFLEVIPTSSTDDRDDSLAAIEITVLAIIFLLATIGNAFILYALMVQKRIRPLSRIYFLIAHLSFADLLVAIFNIFPQLVWDITFRFKGGDIMCRFIKFMQVFVLYLSTYVLVAMSLDRYFAVIGNRTPWKSSRKLSKCLVILAWSISIIFALPQVFIFSYREVKENVYDCWANFPEFLQQHFYVTWFVLSAFGVPLIIISICYGAICCKIWSYKYNSMIRGGHSVKYQNTVLTASANTESIFPPAGPLCESVMIENAGANGRSSDTSVEDGDSSVSTLISTAKIKTIKLTTIIIVCFVVCWSPFCVTQLYLTYSPPEKDSDVGPIHTIFLLLASLNSCCNPWIYLAFSESLMNHLKKLLLKIGFPCFHPCCNSNEGMGEGNVITQTIGRGHRNAVDADERTKQEDRMKEDSIGASDDDDGNNRHFIAMDQLNKATSRATTAQTEIKKGNNVERSKRTNDGRDFDDRVHRPSDPLLTTSTKMTGI